MRQCLVELDTEGRQQLTLIQFETLLRRLGVELTRHQVISVHRRLAGDGGSTLPISVVLEALLA